MNEKLKKEIEEMKELDIFQMGCGLEDLGITDRYEAMEYGYNKAIEGILELLNNFYLQHTTTMQLTTHQLTTQEAILKRLYPGVSIEEAKKKESQQLQDDGSVLNKPIYVLQKSSQSREVQEESTSPTESEKKDFGMIDNIIDGIRNDIKDHGFRRNDLRDIVKSFLSSNGYL